MLLCLWPRSCSGFPGAIEVLEVAYCFVVSSLKVQKDPKFLNRDLHLFAGTLNVD